ncbi:MAG: lipopolysaccharide biosynthesis protein [Aliishimia sp.]
MFDFRFYFALFLRRLPYILIFTVAGSAMGLGLALTLPPEYRAQARLVVESEQIPGDLAESTVRTAATEQLQIIEQRIKARGTLLDMSNRLDIYADEDRSDGPLRPDEIVEDLRGRIQIRTSGGTQLRGRINALLVDVSFTAGSAGLAAEVTNEVVTLMQQENRAMRTGVSGQTLEFFEQEVERLNEQLSQRGESIIRFQEGNRDALPESLEFRRNQLIAAQEELLEIARDEAEISDRRDAVVKLFEDTGGVEGINDDAVAGLTPEERQLRQLLERYTTSVAVLSLDNPRVQVMKAQIDALEKLVTDQAAATSVDGSASTAVTTRNSLYDLQVAELDSQLEFMNARREQLVTEMAELQRTIEATPANAIALDTLERDYAATRAQYDGAVSNRARAKTGDIIEALSKGERITLVDAAVPPEEPASPNRPRLAMMGMAGGLFVAFAFVAVLELLNTSIRRAQDITRQLDITPFGTLPFIRTRRDIIRRRIALLIILTVIAGSVVGGLWGVNEYVIPLDRALEKVLESLPEFDLQI